MAGYAQVFEELDAGYTPTMSYTIGDDLLTQANNDDTAIRHLMYDGHGSIRLLTDSNGEIAATYAYDAYGNAEGFDPAAADIKTKYLYAGEQYDANLGMSYLRGRYYNSNNATFNRPDPFAGSPYDPQSLHKYAYARANPVMHVDPSGELEFSLFGLHVNISMQSILQTIRTAGAVTTIRWGTNAVVAALVGLDIIQGLQGGATLSAGTIGVGATHHLGRRSPFGVAANLEAVIGKNHPHNYGIYLGGGLTTNNNTWSVAGYVGLVFNAANSGAYKGLCKSVTLSFGLLPSKARNYIREKIQTFLPKLHRAFTQRSGAIGAVTSSIDPQIITKASNVLTRALSALSSPFSSESSITLWSGGWSEEGGRTFGFTYSPGLLSGGHSKMMSTSFQYYLKLHPWGEGNDVDF